MFIYFVEASVDLNDKLLLAALRGGFNDKIKGCKFFWKRFPRNSSEPIPFAEVSFKNKEDMDSYKESKENNRMFKVAGRPVLKILEQQRRPNFATNSSNVYY